jgi:hypothetical protein
MQQYPQQPQYPVQPPAPKPSFFQRRIFFLPMWLFLIAICGSCGLVALAASHDNTNSTSTGNASSSNTATSSHTAQWTTVQTFSGTGAKKTPTFHIGNTWQINWSCTVGSFSGIDYNVIVAVYKSDGSLFDVPLNTMCKSGNASGQTTMHQGGDVYLDINSEGDWKFEIQEMK